MLISNQLFAFWVIFPAFVVICWLSTLRLTKRFFQERYLSVKRFGSRSGQTECRSWSGSNLFSKVISRWQNLPPARKGLNTNTVCLIWFFTSHQQALSFVGTGLPGLTSTKLGLMLDTRTQHSDAGEAWTCGPTVSSQALYHWGTALPQYWVLSTQRLLCF